MKRIILTLLLINIYFFSHAQDKSDVASEGLKGNVKSVIIRGFAAETVEGKTKKRFPIATTIKRFTPSGLLTEAISGTGYDTIPVHGTDIRGARIVYKYDHLDNLLGSCSYYTDGRLSDSSIHEVDKMGNRTYWKIYKGGNTPVWEYVREYDNVGNLLETNDYHNGRLETRHLYRYNDAGKITKEGEYDEYGRLKWEQNTKYDANGNKTEMIEYNTQTGKEARHYYKYDEQNRPIEDDEYASETTKKYKKILTSYDAEGNITGTKQYNENGVLIYEGRFDKYNNHLADVAYNEDGSLHDKITAEYKYDAKGNEIEETLHYTDGSGNISVSRYEYDQQNNWVRKTVFEDGEASRMIERDIKYY